MVDCVVTVVELERAIRSPFSKFLTCKHPQIISIRSHRVFGNLDAMTYFRRFTRVTVFSFARRTAGGTGGELRGFTIFVCIFSLKI